MKALQRKFGRSEKLIAKPLSSQAAWRRRLAAIIRLSLSTILTASSTNLADLHAALRGVSAPVLVSQQVDKHGRLKGKDSIPFSYVDDPPKKTIESIRELWNLKASDDQEILSYVLVNVGAGVQQFLNDIVDITAKEEIIQEKLFDDGEVKERRQQRFDYMILARSPREARLLEEYRTDPQGKPTTQSGLEEGYSTTWGFAATCLHFAPWNQDGSRFRYLGTEEVNSSEVYVVAFAQRPGEASVTGKYSVGTDDKVIFVQGIVWIAKSNFQILRIRTDLLKPDVRLSRQTTDVRFAEVHVVGLTQTFWLPQEVTVYSNWLGERLRNRHQYSDYRRFRVTAVIKPVAN